MSTTSASGTGMMGLLTLIVQSGMLAAAEQKDLLRLRQEAEALVQDAEMRHEKAEDAVNRLEDKLEKAKAEAKAAEGDVQDANWVLDAIFSRLSEEIA